jgi:hypothetical protein
MGQGMAVLRSKDPEGVAQEMWVLFAVYQAIHTLGARRRHLHPRAARAAAPGGRVKLVHHHAAPDR